jgi:hypothetical protein
MGMGKVVGAMKTQIVKQFYGESCLFTLISLFIALVIVWLVLPVFNDISGKTILTNCPPALVYFLRKASKTQLIFWQPNQIERIGVALEQIGIEKLQKELGEKRCDLLLYFPYPEIACFGEEDLRYLTQNYHFTILESGEYDTLLFYLN